MRLAHPQYLDSLLLTSLLLDVRLAPFEPLELLVPQPLALAIQSHLHRLDNDNRRLLLLLAPPPPILLPRRWLAVVDFASVAVALGLGVAICDVFWRRERRKLFR